MPNLVSAQRGGFSITAWNHFIYAFDRKEVTLSGGGLDLMSTGREGVEE